MEPERPIEKLLRTYARKRRDEPGAPDEVPPATRRRLQSEVTRRNFPARQGSSFAIWFAGLRPRLALAAAVLATAGISAWLVLSATQKSQMRLAKQQEAIAPDSLAPQEAPVTSPSLRSRRTSQMEKTKSLEDLKLESADKDATASKRAIGETAGGGKDNVPADVAAFKPTLELGELAGIKLVTNEFGLATGQGSLEPATLATAHGSFELVEQVVDSLQTLATTDAPAPTLSVAIAPGQSLSIITGQTVALTKAAIVSQATQRFVQVAAPPGAVAGRPNSAARDTNAVLVAFRWEQNGSEVQVVDEDGSVYRGSLDLAGEHSDVSTATAQGNAPARNGAAIESRKQVGQSYRFQLSGTNRSLKQHVVFNGSLLTQATPGSNAANLFTNAENQLQGAWNAPQVPLANSRIAGTAVIDNHRKLQILAVPAGP